MDQTDISWTLIILISLHFTHADKVCRSVNIKHEKDLHMLKDCTVVVGYVTISNLQLFEDNDIASPLEEITDYLLIYRVEGLVSIEHLFPNLTIIRGHELLFDKYSLVVFENRNMRDLGLKSLLKIRRGSIKVESNPVLCFADTVNWIYLMEDHSQQHFSLKGNLDPNECPECLKHVKKSETEFLMNGCWNLKNFQRKKPIPHYNDCPDECGMQGCTTDRTCCSKLCLTGCSAENCRICKNFRNLQGNCVEFCNIPYYTLADQCITEKECRDRGLIPHAGTCSSECPKSYQQVSVNGQIHCNLLCAGNFTIRSKIDLDDVRDCITIRGSLHIELKDDKSEIIGHLEQALGGIKEITGSLKITKSHQLVSLGFFKNLDTIKGDELIDREISFYVVDNFYLEEIWPANHKVAIFKGRIFFHLNPRLCYEKILQLVPSMRSYSEIRIRDASYNSNGERVVCGDDVRELYPVVEDVNATAVRIKVDPRHYNDREVVLGYLHYYKEAPVKNVTMFDGRHGCGRSAWRMDMTLDRNIRHIISNLKPYTQYAFFVKTITMVDYHRKFDWYSAIMYFKTLPMKPGPVHKIFSTPVSATAIMVHWWPPKNPNGLINKYLMRYEPTTQHTNKSQAYGEQAYIRDRDCDCGIPADNRGPPPDDLNYYSREQIIVENALQNLVYVKAPREERALRRKRESGQTSQGEGSPNSIGTSENAAKDAKSIEEQKRIDEERYQEARVKELLDKIERESILSQDTGIDNFPIEHPSDNCFRPELQKEDQDDQNCINSEQFDGIEIPGKMYSYLLENLESGIVYRISIRACVDGLKNGCGPEQSILAQTVSKNLEYFLKGP